LGGKWAATYMPSFLHFTVEAKFPGPAAGRLPENANKSKRLVAGDQLHEDEQCVINNTQYETGFSFH